jgi:hypothetical protein
MKIRIDPLLDAESIKKAFPIGCTVELLEDEVSELPVGSQGTVVGYSSQINEQFGKVWLIIEWFAPIHTNTNCTSGWAPYGPFTYRYKRFNVLGSNPPVGKEQPRNNDNRETCFWCSAPTRKAGGGAYDVCTICGR